MRGEKAAPFGLSVSETSMDQSPSRDSGSHAVTPTSSPMSPTGYAASAAFVFLLVHVLTGWWVVGAG